MYLKIIILLDTFPYVKSKTVIHDVQVIFYLYNLIKRDYADTYNVHLALTIQTKASANFFN